MFLVERISRRLLTANLDAWSSVASHDGKQLAESLNCDFSSTDPCESEEQVFTFACELNTASIINLRKFSSLQKLLRVTSWVLRFVHNIRNRFNKRSDDLSTEEIDGAENFGFY
ncbi:hypothetical protein TNCV_3369961 [Trichonephila clavipes]|uniref:Uncharacterized protein n=1 Tax=Trichonephila clavipes TaxID=2585209 RepID=A0A8X6R7S5_TRICX|nr:hypothetical protein TNCV_3369961 [Trichonephila clavipes]